MDKYKQDAEIAAWKYLKAKENFELVEEDFRHYKEEFYSAMDEYFSGCKGKSIEIESNTIGHGSLVVNRIEKTSISWDAEKLERKLERDIAKKVISKKYSISDMNGLAAYLRECGVDPKIFKKFLTIEKTVDEKMINKLGDTGYLSVRQIEGCYMVNKQSPYYTIKVKEV